MLSHDANIKRMTDGYGDIHNMTYEKLQSYSYDNGANIGNYPGLKLATFSQALDECAKYQMIPCVEIKKENGMEGLEDVVAALREKGLLKNASSFPSAMNSLRKCMHSHRKSVCGIFLKNYR